MNIITKIALLKSNDLYNTLDILKEFKIFDKLGFSEIPIEDSPFIENAYYFKLSSVSFNILKNSVTREPNLYSYITETNDIKNKVVKSVINFIKVCEENNTIEYFIINKEKN